MRESVQMYRLQRYHTLWTSSHLLSGERAMMTTINTSPYWVARFENESGLSLTRSHTVASKYIVLFGGAASECTGLPELFLCNVPHQLGFWIRARAG